MHKFIFIFALFALYTSIVFADNENNNWYAGTTFEGSIETAGLIWNCSGGTCKLSGPYGNGLNMAVCKSLSQQVGGLVYYYNDTGMIWNETKNSDLLAQCNRR